MFEAVEDIHLMQPRLSQAPLFLQPETFPSFLSSTSTSHNYPLKGADVPDFIETPDCRKPILGP